MADTSQTAGGLTIACVRPVGMPDDDWELERQAFESFVGLVRSLVLTRRSRCLVAVRLGPDEIRLPETVG